MSSQSKKPSYPLFHSTPAQIECTSNANPHPPAPPLPRTNTVTARPRINPGYTYLKDIIEKFDKTTLPAFSGDPHIYAAPCPRTSPLSHCEKIRQPKPNSDQKKDKHAIPRMDPLLHVLTLVFLPHRCDTSTCLERFQEFYNTITPTEWEFTATWKYGIQNNVFEIKGIASTLGPDAAVSRAMKRWAERVLGTSLETIFATKMMESYGIYGATPGQQYALGLSASYKEDSREPVYHYPSLQFYAGHPLNHNVYNSGPIHTGNMGNVYSPQRAPQSAFTPRPIPIVHPELHRYPKLVGMPIANPVTATAATASGTDPDRESSTQIANGSRGLKSQQKADSLKNLYSIPEKPHSTQPPSRPQNSLPVPNPSGRATPPHKRSRKERKDTPKLGDWAKTMNPDPTMSNWIKGSKNDAVKLIVNKWAGGKQRVTEKKGKRGLDNSESSPRFTREDLQAASPNFQPALPTAPLTDNKDPGGEKPNDIAKIVVSKWAQGKLQTALERQDSMITNEEDGSLPIDLQLPRSKMEKNKQKPQSEELRDNRSSGVERLNNGRDSSSPNGRNRSQKAPPKTIPTPTHQAKGPTKNPAMLARYLPTESDLQTAIKASSAKPDYARAASGANRRNEDLKAFTETSISPPTPTNPAPITEKPWNTVTNWRNDGLRTLPKGSSPINSSRNTSAVFIPSHAKNPTWSNEKNQDTGTPIGDYLSHTKDPIPTNSPQAPTSPSSGKSWSSIVTGRIDDTSIIMNQGQQNNMEAIDYPELGSSLSTIPPGRLPRSHLLKKKTSLSAQAKIFEPAGPHHAASFDPYLRNTKIPTPSTSLPKPILYTQTPAETMDTGYDSLLEIFYTTPQFTEYLNKSYDWLLFQQNYLRAQYQRIGIFFENEWNMITSEQRKAVFAKAIANLSERVDKVQFWDIPGVEDMLSELGLSTTNSKERGNGNRNTYHGRSYLRTRAEYCFDLDPDAFGMTPHWLFNIIGWLLGTPPPLRHRFGPGLYNRTPPATTSDYGAESSSLGPADIWCPDDCSECADSEQTISGTRWAGLDQDPTRRKDKSSNSIPGSPMLERFLDEIDSSLRPMSHESHTTEKNQRPISPEWLPSNPKNSLPNYPVPNNSRQDQRPPPHLNIATEPRLMSNRFQDPIFKPRSSEWTATHLGRAQFMESVEIDIALFYCELIEEILHIFGEIRRERVWYTLPTIWDWYNGPTPSPPQSRFQPRGGRPRVRNVGPGNSIKRSMSCPAWGSKELNQLNRNLIWAQREAKLEEAKKIVEVERKRVRDFVRETQRTVDWVGAGLRLVERETDREVERAWDGGLWTVPVPREEKVALEEEFAKWCVWRG